MVLSPKQLAFDAAVKAMRNALYRGVADLEFLSTTLDDDALVFSLFSIRDILNSALQVEGQHIIGDAPHAPFYLDYIDSDASAALAFKDADNSFIGITIPFVLELWEAMRRVVKSDALVARIGVPEGHDRIAVQRALFFMLLGFVIAHEVTHHTHGHWIPVRRSERNLLPQQARELDADGWATALTLNTYLLEKGRALALESLNLEHEPESVQDDVIVASFFVAHAASLFVRVPSAIDVGRVYLAPHPPLSVRHKMVSVFAMKFVDDHRASLRETMTNARYSALMGDVSRTLWTSQHEERWRAHHAFRKTPDGEKYHAALMSELNEFRDLLRQWEADATTKKTS
jgi:hypothetical protein